MDKHDPVVIAEPASEWQGELLVQFLRNRGISAFLVNAASNSLFGDGLPALTPIQVVVPQEVAEEATVLAGTFIECGQPPEFAGQDDVGMPTLGEDQFEPLDESEFDGDESDDPQA